MTYHCYAIEYSEGLPPWYITAGDIEPGKVIKVWRFRSCVDQFHFVREDHEHRAIVKKQDVNKIQRERSKEGGPGLAPLIDFGPWHDFC